MSAIIGKILRIGAVLFALIFSGLGLGALIASFVVGPLAAYAVLFLTVALALTWALRG